MGNKEELLNLLKKRKAASVRQLARGLNASDDFIRGLIDSDKRYVQGDRFIRLAGLGTDLCIVCAEDVSRDKESNHFSIAVELPREYLANRSLDRSLSYRVRGHRKCYEGIDVFFRQDGLYCIDCGAFHGQWIDGNEVEETCSRLGHTDVGHRGVLASNRMCNFFSPDYDMRSGSNAEARRNMQRWEKIKPAIETRAANGYKNLVQLLEKARLIQ